VLKGKTFFTWKGLLLWSNHFYGIAAALLSLETHLAIFKTAPSLYLVVFIYTSTVVYYTYAYFDEIEIGIYNERSQWYIQNKRYLKLRQFVLIVVGLYIAFIKLKVIEVFFSLTPLLKFIIILTLLISFFYQCAHLLFKRLQIRNKGLLKSLSITWVWVVMCGVIPLLVNANGPFNLNPFRNYIFLYLLQLFSFILILAILFDIKDLNRDSDEKVKTLIVRYGIKPTMCKLVFPLLFLYLALSLFIFFRIEESPLYLITTFLILFSTLLVINFVQKRTVIHESILLIDGLIIFKALIGIIRLLLVLG